MTTLLTETGVFTIDANVSGEELWLSPAAAESATGWVLKEEGFCRGPLCVPISPTIKTELVSNGNINISDFWRHMNRPILHDESGEVWVLGESAADRTAQLQSLEAPDFTLPDLQGKFHSLAEHRGKKVFLCSWASW